MRKGHTVKTLIAIPTFRKEPRFREFFQSLITNTSFVGLDLQILVVDGCLWYDRMAREYALEVARVGCFLPVHHIPPEPSIWQGPSRKTVEDCWDASTPRNTALRFAAHRNFDYVFFLDDSMTLTKDWLKVARPYVEMGVPVGGPYQSTHDDGRTSGAADHRMVEMPRGGPCPWGWLYTCVLGVPLPAALAVDGFDRLYAGQHGCEDCDFAIRLGRHLGPTTKAFFEPGLMVNQLTARHDKPASPKTLHSSKNRVMAGDRVAFANEYLIEKLRAESTRTLPLVPNGLRDPTRAHVTDWRDGAPLDDLWKFTEGRGTPAEQDCVKRLAGVINT